MSHPELEAEWPQKTAQLPHDGLVQSERTRPSGQPTGVARAEQTRRTDRAVRRRSVRSVKKTSGRAVRRASAHVARKTPSGANSCRRNSFVARMVVDMAVVFGLAGVVFQVGPLSCRRVRWYRALFSNTPTLGILKTSSRRQLMGQAGLAEDRGPRSGTSAYFGRASFEGEYIFIWQVCGRVCGIPSSLKHNPDAAEYDDAH